MSTVRETLQARIDTLKAEVVVLEAHLAAGGTWLEQEFTAVEEWFKTVIAKIKGTPTPSVQ